MSNFSFAIISDIHVYTSTGSSPGAGIPSNFSKVIAQLASLTPRFVVVSGDATSGNPDDGASRSKVDGWWRGFREALRPLTESGIPVLPIAGNHDHYTQAQRDGYQAAWNLLSEDVSSQFVLWGKPPLCYSLQVDELHLSLLHVIDQDLPSEIAKVLRADAEQTPVDALRLCIGHVPLVSMMGRTSESYRDELGKLLVSLGYSAFFAGHEHLVWEQELSFPEGNLHHIHVGTASGTYNFPLSRSTYEKHCSGNQGTLPYSGQRFALDPGTRQQADKTNVCVVQVSDGTYSVTHLALRGGELQPFGIP
jgi:3',5'-cyclic AMP phosphodiesterase CpdA